MIEMNPSMKEQLRQWKQQHQEVKKKSKKRREKQPVRKQESLSERELLSLMGTNMQTLKRGRGGAFKR